MTLDLLPPLHLLLSMTVVIPPMSMTTHTADRNSMHGAKLCTAATCAMMGPAPTATAWMVATEEPGVRRIVGFKAPFA